MFAWPLRIGSLILIGAGLTWVGLKGPIGQSAPSDSPALAQAADASAIAPAGGVTSIPAPERPIDDRLAQRTATALLRRPIDCQLGKDCFVMLYPDHDPSTGERDSMCRHLTYDGHNGTDFAIPFWTPQTAVPVVATAAGTVSAMRDGVPDRRLTSPEARSTVAGIECGNGVMLDHGNGWQTQYCHMKQGSVRVKIGDRVQAGNPLGLVGLSGMTTFPHVHVTVRKDGKEVDPLLGGDRIAGCATGNNSNTVWNDGARNYVATGLIRSGFAPKQPVEDELWRGEFQSNQIPGQAEALTFWVHAFGVQKGDVEYFKLLAPDGSIVTDYQRPIDQDHKQCITYVGKGTRRSPLMPGTWTASYRLMRGNQTLIQLDRQQAVVR
jgi:murein DD-endopeptidase MepM/ murein hydrolase activator NlpD